MTPDDIVLVALRESGQVVGAEEEDAVFIFRQVKAENWRNLLGLRDLLYKRLNFVIGIVLRGEADNPRELIRFQILAFITDKHLNFTNASFASC